MAGLTSEGLTVLILNEIRADISARLRARFGPLDLSDRSIEGQIAAIVSEHLSLLWESLEAIYASQDPDKAAGAALDAVCALTGTFRLVPTFSTSVLTLTGDTGTVIAAASLATSSPDFQFATDSSATLVAATAWATPVSYVLGDVVTKNGQVYVALNAGTSGAPGPSHTARGPYGDPTTVSTDGGITFTTIPPDGTVDWLWLGEGVAYADAIAECSIVGAKSADGYEIDEIVTLTTGWLGVVNQLPASTGRDEQTDESLRILRELEIAQPGSSTSDAIRASLLEVLNVSAVTVFVNNTDAIDADGMPPHSVEALVRDGDDQDIVDAIFADVAAGIATTGNTSGTATDSQGIDHAISFSRPVEIPIYVEVTVIKDPATYPTDGADQIKTAIVAYGDAQATGVNAVASRLGHEAFVDGVLDVTSVKISTSPGPTLSTTIAISLRELATYDALNITIIESDGVP